MSFILLGKMIKKIILYILTIKIKKIKNGLNYKDLIIDKTSIKYEDTADGILDYLVSVGNPPLCI